MAKQLTGKAATAGKMKPDKAEGLKDDVRRPKRPEGPSGRMTRRTDGRQDDGVRDKGKGYESRQGQGPDVEICLGRLVIDWWGLTGDEADDDKANGLTTTRPTTTTKPKGQGRAGQTRQGDKV